MAKGKESGGSYNPNSLTRKDLAQLLNTSRVAIMRRQMGLKPSQAKCTTQNTISKWVEAGLPTTPEGKLSLIDVAAWLACDRKDHGAGRRGSASSEAGDSKDIFTLKEDLLKSQIRANNASADYREIKTELEEIKKRIQDGELIESEEVKKGRIDRARYIREKIERLPQLSSRLQGKPIVEMRKELKEIANEILLDIAGDRDE